MLVKKLVKCNIVWKVKLNEKLFYIYNFCVRWGKVMWFKETKDWDLGVMGLMFGFVVN